MEETSTSATQTSTLIAEEIIATPPVDPTGLIAQKWLEIKILTDSMEKDIAKNANKKNLQAGIRVRKGFRTMKSWLSDLIKITIAADKTTAMVREDRKLIKKGLK